MRAPRRLCVLVLAGLVLGAGLAGPGAQPVQAQSQNRGAKAPAPPPAAAPPAEAPKPAPYDDRLARLSEVLGAVQFLRKLCDQQEEPGWRNLMEKLLATETNGEDERRQRFTAAFNRGYRTFAAVYTRCTPSAVQAEQRYRNEGATLAAEIAARYGN